MKANVIIDMEERGFFNDFHIENENLRCFQSNEVIAPEQFDILESHLCWGPGYPGVFSIIYGIALREQPVKGILMTDVRSYSCGMSVYLWSKLNAKGKVLMRIFYGMA